MLDSRQKEMLLTIEPQTTHCKEKYQKEIQRMIEKPLSTWSRVSFGLSGLLGIAFFLFFGFVFFTTPDKLPLVPRLSFAVGAVAGLVWACFAWTIVKKGTMNLKKQGTPMVGVMWIVVVFVMTSNLMIGMQMTDAAQGSRTILSGLVFLVMGVLFMVQHWIERSELNVKEAMLRLELQIAELREKGSEPKD